MPFVNIITCLALYSALWTLGLAVKYYFVVSRETECGYVNGQIVTVK